MHNCACRFHAAFCTAVYFWSVILYVDFERAYRRDVCWPYSTEWILHCLSAHMRRPFFTLLCAVIYFFDFKGRKCCHFSFTLLGRGEKSPHIFQWKFSLHDFLFSWPKNFYGKRVALNFFEAWLAWRGKGPKILGGHCISFKMDIIFLKRNV